MNSIKSTVLKTLMYLVMLFVVIISLFPIIWVTISAFKTNAQIMENPFSLPSKIDLGAFQYVFSKYNFVQYTFNSFAIALAATLISLFIYSMGAYVIAKYNFWGKNLFFALFTLTLLVPGFTRTQPIFSLIMKLNLYDTKSGLVLVYISGGMAMSMFILKASFMSIPKELNEAAEIEGAGFFKVFWKINVPLATSGMATAGILMFLGNWNEYFYAMLLTSSDKNRTLPLALQFFNEAFSYDYTKMFAALTFVILPGIIIYIFAQDQIKESVATTGSKG